MDGLIRVCFVCLGNIIRSPVAEALFRQLVEQSGAGQRYEVDSAATSGWHIGDQPDPRMQRVAFGHGLSYQHRSRQFHPADLDRFDLVLAMDHENEEDLSALARSKGQRSRIHLLREFDPRGTRRDEVPDPYYGGVEEFERVYQIIERSCRGLFERLEREGLDQ